ncbi:MAG: ABC transporter substrate-binding protein [Acidimicrobiales bacterium]
MADIVRTSLASDGATVVGGGSIDPNATDYSTTVNPIKAANVDAVYFGGYYDAAARLLKQMRDAGVQAKFVSDDGTKDPKFVSEATAADANGAYVTYRARRRERPSTPPTSRHSTPRPAPTRPRAMTPPTSSSRP